jgi:DNA-binding MarR family transcriptional regulator
MDADQVRRVRSFNRTVSQRIGALNDHFLDRARPLGEARLLYEIGSAGAEVRKLRARLELDSGYVSRLLRSLERQGLVKDVRSGGRRPRSPPDLDPEGLVRNSRV